MIQIGFVFRAGPAGLTGGLTPQKSIKSAVGGTLVRVSALTRYSGHLFSRLSRGVPNMYKQMAWPPLGRKGTGTEWEEIMREAWVNGCGFMVSGGLARLTSAPFALGRMATALGRSLRVRRKGWGHHSGPHLGWREGWLTRELFSHSAWGAVRPSSPPEGGEGKGEA